MFSDYSVFAVIQRKVVVIKAKTIPIHEKCLKKIPRLSKSYELYKGWQRFLYKPFVTKIVVLSIQIK